MRSVEKNDVDITKLFRYTKEVEITDSITNDVGKFYLRLVGDADLGKARVFGLRKSAQLRKALRDHDSGERLAFVTESEDFVSKEILVESILLLAVSELQREIIDMTNVPEPKAPKSDASLEKQEAFQAEVDDYEEKYLKEYNKNAKKVEKRERKTLMALEEMALYVVYESAVIDRLCTEEMSSKYYEMCVYLGTFADKANKKRAFQGIEEFENAASHLKDRLTEQYRYLELGMTELKKSPEATE